jgi:integrase
MRRGEILKLRWPSVDFANAEIRLDPGTTKNDDPRTIPLAGELLELLCIERTRNPKSEFVFVRAGERIDSFRKAWNSACVRAGLGVYFCRTCDALLPSDGPCTECKKTKRWAWPRYRGLIFHDLRRTGVRNLIRAGVHERVAMEISGHKTPAVFYRYNIVSGRDLKDAAKKLETYLAGEFGDNLATISPSAATAAPKHTPN